MEKRNRRGRLRIFRMVESGGWWLSLPISPALPSGKTGRPRRQPSQSGAADKGTSRGSILPKREPVQVLLLGWTRQMGPVRKPFSVVLPGAPGLGGFVSRSLIALLLTLCLAVAPAAAQDPGGEPPPNSDPPESDSAQSDPDPQTSGNATEPQATGMARCRPAQFSSIDPSSPTKTWVILDPDGCVRRTVYRLIGWEPPL